MPCFAPPHLSCHRNENATMGTINCVGVWISAVRLLGCGLSLRDFGLKRPCFLLFDWGFFFPPHKAPEKTVFLERWLYSALWMCEPCSSPGQMPGALQKIGENCGDGKAETKITWFLKSEKEIPAASLHALGDLSDLVTGSENFIFLVLGSWHKVHQQYWLWSLQSWPCRSYPLVPARDLSLPPGPVSAICFLQFANKFSEFFLLFAWNLPSSRSVKILFWIKGVSPL